MLVLSRKQEESVIVGGANGFEPMLKVTVLGIDDGKVRLGFEANKGYPVHRSEVWERIRSAAGRQGMTREMNGVGSDALLPVGL